MMLFTSWYVAYYMCRSNIRFQTVRSMYVCMYSDNFVLLLLGSAVLVVKETSLALVESYWISAQGPLDLHVTLHVI